MDPGLVPPTAPGGHLLWLMSLKAEPTTEEIDDHLDVSEATREDPGLASGLLAFGTMVRELPGAVTQSEDATLRLQLNQGAELLCGVVSIKQGGSGKIGLLDLREPPVEGEVELDRIRLLFDGMARTYEQLTAHLVHYSDRARAWLNAVARDGFTILDVGCGPGHLIADLPPSVDVIGCDVSPEMVRLAALARSSGTFVVHDYHQPFPAQWPLADVTVALGCLEFCSDLTQVARNLAAATKPEGQLLLTLPRAEPPSQRTLVLHPQEITVRFWEDSEVVGAFGASGLDVISHEIGPGFTSPAIGTVHYGYWELKARGADVAR